MSEALATPKTPLYVTYVDFKKAFDSVDRSLMLCKLKVVGLPGKVIRAICPIVRENFVQITTAECLSHSVTQNVGLAQGECLSPLLYSIFTHDLPSVIEGQGGVKTLLYADDLAICARDLRRRYTVRFARTEPADCPVHGSIVTCDMSLECPGHVKIG